MLEEAHSEAIRLLSENREALDKIAAFLIERETITGEEFMKIFREIRDGEGEKPSAEAGQEEAGQEEGGQAEVREATAEQAPAEEPPVGSIKE